MTSTRVFLGGPGTKVWWEGACRRRGRGTQHIRQIIGGSFLGMERNLWDSSWREG